MTYHQATYRETLAELEKGDTEKACVSPFKAQPCITFHNDTNKWHLTDHGKTHVKTYLNYGLQFPDKELLDHLTIALRGPVAVSPAHVRSDMLEERWKEISKFERKVLAVEMEGAALFYAHMLYNEGLSPGQSRCEVLLVKGVMDFADPDKDDSFKEYAARASAAWVLHFLMHHAVLAFPRLWSNQLE